MVWYRAVCNAVQASPFLMAAFIQRLALLTASLWNAGEPMRRSSFSMPTRSTVDVAKVLAQLTVKSVECQFLFDREAFILPTEACACARGISGHLLTARSPELTRNFFKPGQGGNTPAAFIIQPVTFERGGMDAFRFRVFCWERSGKFLAALIDALKSSPGCSWGGTEAHITDFQCSPPENLVFEGTGLTVPARLRLLTPLAIKAHVRDNRPPRSDGKPRSGRRVLAPVEINLGRICQALVARINNLNSHFGNGGNLDAQPFLAEAALIREYDRNLQKIHARRYSSAQNTSIHLGGVAGWLDLGPRLSPRLHDLLALGSVFHLGHRTADGCGCVAVEEIPQQ